MPDENAESPAETPESTPVETAVVSSKKPKKHLPWKKIVLFLLVLLVGFAGGYLWRDHKAKQDQKTQAVHTAALNSDIANLNAKLKKAAADAKAKAAAANTTPTAVRPTAAAISNIKASITSGNTAALEGYMAASVHVVIAASEGVFDHSPSAAVEDITSYLKNATDPWNFDVPAATLASWQAGAYASYFPATAVAGEATNHYVISFTFDTTGKISGVFMAANSDLLT